MTVVVLRLRGLEVSAAEDAARQLLDRDNYPYLDRTLIVDDVHALGSHAGVFQRLLRSRRLDHVLCVAVGPRDPDPLNHAPGHLPAESRQIRIPPAISSSRGSALVWVGDTRGIDCRLSAAANADGHMGRLADGVECLVEVLSADAVYDKVLELVRGMRDGAASPGLHLADADDEAAMFWAALAIIITRFTGAGAGPAAGPETPFLALLPGAAGTAGPVRGGELDSCRERITETVAAISAALAKPSGGVFRKAPPDVTNDVAAVGSGLRALRDQVSRLFTAAHSPGELTEAQRAAVTAAGVELATAAGIPDSGEGTGKVEPNPSPVLLAVAEGIDSGDTLPRLVRRLNLTAQQLKHVGSGAYLPEVDKVCPPGLLSQLASPASRPPGKAGVDVWRRELGLAEATAAADSLVKLVAAVATREWSGSATVAAEVSRTRIALEGVAKELSDRAGKIITPVTSGAHAVRCARLADTLMPIMYDLVGKVLAAEADSPSLGGQEAFERAQDKTAHLISEWAEHAVKNGATSKPSFATSVMHDHTYVGDDVATLKETLLYDPMDRMWQLCEPDDLGVLDVRQPPRVVAFASRMDKETLGEHLRDDMTWIASGTHAGLLRLVPLRPGTVRPDWEADEPGEPGMFAS